MGHCPELFWQLSQACIPHRGYSCLCPHSSSILHHASHSVPWAECGWPSERCVREWRACSVQAASLRLTCHEDAKCESAAARFWLLAASCSLALSRACAAFAFCASLATDCPCSKVFSNQRTIAKERCLSAYTCREHKKMLHLSWTCTY